MGVLIPGATDGDGKPLAEEKKEPKTRRGCPKCGSEDFSGRNLGGTVLFRCRNQECKTEWAGGMGTYNHAGVKPNLPPTKYVPEARYNLEKIDPESKGQFEELRRPVDTRSDFRRGAPIPTAEDEEL